MCSVMVLTVGAGNALCARPSVLIRPAERIQFPGVVHGGRDPNLPGDIDYSSPIKLTWKE